MARPLFEIVDDAGHLEMYGAAATGRHAEVHGRSQQRVRKTHHAVGADGDRPGRHRLVQERLSAIAERTGE